MFKRKKICLILIILIHSSLFFSPVLSMNLRGKVVSVADGDTITILEYNKRQHKIRLYGIDSPEGGQAFGNIAKKATSGLIYGKHVDVNVLDTDRYGRQVGLIFLNNVNINAELIKQGYAWVYPQYCKIKACSSWKSIEADARNKKLGLWADPNPIPPWNYRASKRTNTSKSGSSSTMQPKNTASKSGSYHGNVKSKVFHSPDCQNYNCKNCMRSFSSIGAAKSAGYRPHNQCVR